MEITELFGNSFNYATSDWTKLLTIGGLLVAIVILFMIAAFSAAIDPTLSLILFILVLVIALLITLVIMGYGFSVLRETVTALSDTPPEFDFVNNFIDGLKLFVLEFVYLIVPMIIAAILYLIFGLTNVAVSDPGVFLASTLIVNIIVALIMALFMLLAYIAMARLAETDSFSSIFEFNEIFETISKIGWDF
jgi:hypothetical protein